MASWTRLEWPWDAVCRCGVLETQNPLRTEVLLTMRLGDLRPDDTFETLPPSARPCQRPWSSAHPKAVRVVSISLPRPKRSRLTSLWPHSGRLASPLAGSEAAVGVLVMIAVPAVVALVVLATSLAAVLSSRLSEPVSAHSL